MFSPLHSLLELYDDGVPTKIKSKVIRDPIHGYIKTTLLERAVIDDPIFQRLRRLHQLQTAYHIYPGAEHSRFQHCIGVMHLSGKFLIGLLKRTHELAGKERENIRIPDIEELGFEDEKDLISALLAVRLGGLLHDIGHGPYSHAFDEAVISKSDVLRKKGIQSHEDVGYYIFKNYLSEIIIEEGRKLESLINIDLLLEYLDAILVSRKAFFEELGKLRRDKPIVDILRRIIREFVYPSDILDFVMRDSYFTGVREYGMVDVARLINYSIIYSAPAEGEFSPSLEIGLLDTAINALRAFLMSRFWLFNNVYYHRTSRIIDFTVQRLLRSLYVEGVIDFEGIILKIIEEGDVSGYVLLDDYYVLYEALRYGGRPRELAKRILNRKPEYVEIYDKEFIVKRRDEQKEKKTIKYDVSFGDILTEILRRVVKIISSFGIPIDEEDVKIDSPMIRFFPDNPYLPRKSFNIVKIRRDKLIDKYNLTVTDIGIAIDTSLFRIFMKRGLENKINIPLDELRMRIAKEIEKDDLLIKAEMAFQHEIEKTKEIGVTM